MQYGGGDVAPFTVTIWGGGVLCELHAAMDKAKEETPRNIEDRWKLTPFRATRAQGVARKKESSRQRCRLRLAHCTDS
jgi:hypothetical protein